MSSRPPDSSTAAMNDRKGTRAKAAPARPIPPPLETASYAAILRKQLPELREDFGVKWLGIFGSYVRGDQKETSDLDVLVEFSETPGLFKFIALERQLSRLLGVKVDLVMKNALKPAIGRRILAEVVPV